MKRNIILFGDYYLNFLDKLTTDERKKLEKAILLLEVEVKCRTTT